MFYSLLLNLLLKSEIRCSLTFSNRKLRFDKKVDLVESTVSQFPVRKKSDGTLFHFLRPENYHTEIILSRLSRLYTSTRVKKLSKTRHHYLPQVQYNIAQKG